MIAGFTKRNVQNLIRVVSLILLAFFTVACSSNVVQSTGVIEFGTGSFDDDTFNKTNSFSQLDDILIQTDLREPFETTEITYILIKHDNGETIFEEWSQSVDPTWDSLFSEYQIPEVDGELDKGDYTLRMFKNDSELISEGDFTVY